MGASRTFQNILGLMSLCLACHAVAGPLSQATPVPVELAFRPSVRLEGHDVHIQFAIAPDCYLYRERIRVEGPNKEVLVMTLPPGTPHDDAVLGGTYEIYRDAVEWTVSVPDDLSSIKLVYQGCAEKAGICYAAQRRVFPLK